MYYARKTQSSTRVIGMCIALLINVVVGYALIAGMGNVIIEKLTQTQVVIVPPPPKKDETPPPPPPVDVNLPPPPPQVILPDFQFDTPPPPTAITQVAPVAKPQPPAAPKPVAPVVNYSTRPSLVMSQFQEMLASDYPPALLRRKVEGDVQVQFCVSDRGQITNVQVTKSSGQPDFDEATVKGLPKVRMTPGKDAAGKPVTICNPPYPLVISWKLPK